MGYRWSILACAVACCFPSSPLRAQSGPVDLSMPSNYAVLPPVPTLDVPVKMPNTTREPKGEWSISGGVYFMQPVFATNSAFVVNSNAGNVTRQVDFGQGLEVAPYVWLGYVSERGWGVRARWFDFDHGTSAGYAALPGETIVGSSSLGFGRLPVNGTIAAFSNLAVNVADFEATCNFDSAKWSHLLGFGVRYTHLSEDYRATLSNAATRIDLNSGHNLNGAGPCFSLETRRRIGESGFSIYGQMHGAIVFGQAKEAYSAIDNGVLQEFTHSRHEVLPVGELEVGGEYQRCVGRAKCFIQAGFVGQIWWGAGNASNFDPLAASSASNSNLGFIGLAVRVGIRY